MTAVLDLGRTAAPKAPHASRTAAVAAEGWLSSLHIGMGWPEEQPGGLNRMVAGLVHHLPTAKVAAHALVAGSSAVERYSLGHARPFAALSDPLPRRLFLAHRAIRAAIAEQSPDIVALHFALFGFLAAPRRNAALVVHFHGPWSDESMVEGNHAALGRVKHWLESRAYRPAQRFITLSNAFAGLLQRRYGVDRSLIRVVPGGVDVERFRPRQSRRAAREALGLPLDRPIVVTVRRLARRMGLQDLVTAFAEVNRRVPDAMLVIAGGGPLRDELNAQIDGLGLRDCIRLLGRVDDAELPTLFRAADLSVVPTTALEGFGLTSVESLAAGTPALVTPVGGLPEVVRGLSDALVCEATGSDALADRLLGVLAGNVSLPAEEACTAYAAEHFAWELVAERTRAVYREALA